jgi:TrmH family RNA methyltransferase
MTIESHANPKFKYLKKLQKSRSRKKEGYFILEGRPELDIALKQGLTCDSLYYSPAYLSEIELTQLLEVTKGEFPKVYSLKKELFDELAYQHVPGNLIGVFKAFDFELDQLDFDQPVVILENIEKPGNLGAILRTCDALGVQQVVCINTNMDLFNPNVLRNSRGAVFGVKCCFADNAVLFQKLKAHNYCIVAAAINENAIPYTELNLDSRPLALVFGSESKGLDFFWLNNAEAHAIIPLNGIVDSLNVSISVAILASHFISKQRSS